MLNNVDVNFSPKLDLTQEIELARNLNIFSINFFTQSFVASSRYMQDKLINDVANQFNKREKYSKICAIVFKSCLLLNNIAFARLCQYFHPNQNLVKIFDQLPNFNDFLNKDNIVELVKDVDSATLILSQGGKSALRLNMIDSFNNNFQLIKSRFSNGILFSSAFLFFRFVPVFLSHVFKKILPELSFRGINFFKTVKNVLFVFTELLRCFLFVFTFN
jgi:hypothetical protein